MTTQPTASGVSDEMVEAALREWLTRGGYTFAKTDLLAKEPAFAKAMRATLEAALSAKPAQTEQIASVRRSKPQRY